MSSICNRMYDEGGLGLLGPRKQQKQHGIRTRRLSARKIQLHRRDDLTAAELLYNCNSPGSNSNHSLSNSNTAAQNGSIGTRKHSESAWALSSCPSSSSSAAAARSGIHIASAATGESMPIYCTSTSSYSSITRHRRLDMAITSEEDGSHRYSMFFPQQSRSAGGLFSFSSSSLAHVHHLGIESKPQHSFHEQAPVPLPPVAHRMDMPGSPLSPFPASYYHHYHESDYSFPPRRSTLRGYGSFGGGRSGGGGGGGGRRDGDSPVHSSDVPHPGHQEGGDEDGGADADSGDIEGSKLVPSAYTFRRRNAIVEGSEDAPKANDFPQST